MLACFPIIKKSEFSLTIYKYDTTGNENLVRLLATHLNANLVSSCAYNGFLENVCTLWEFVTFFHGFFQASWKNGGGSVQLNHFSFIFLPFRIVIREGFF